MRLRASALAALAALALASCGDDENEVASGPAGVMPAGSPVYVEAVVSPQGEQAERLDSLLAELGELPLIGTITNPGDLIKGAIEDSASGSGVSLNFAEDVDPWLGERLGFSVLSADEDGDPRFVAALETTDESATEEALQGVLEEDAVDNEEHNYEDVTYFTSGDGGYAVGVFSGHLVLATSDEFEAAVDAAGGSDSLADDDRVTAASAELAEDRLATAYVDFNEIHALADSPEDVEGFEQAREAIPELFEEPVAMGFGIDERSLYVDQTTPQIEGQPETAPSPNLESVPGNAFAAVGLDAVGEQIRFAADLYDRVAESGVELEGYPDGGIAEAFEEETGVPLEDAAAALGDGTLWARGDLPDAIEVGSRVTVSDEDTVTALLDELREHAADEEGAAAIGAPIGGAEDGFSVDLSRTDVSDEFELLNVEVSDGSLRAGLFADEGSAEAEKSSGEADLGATEAFGRAEDALGSEFELLGMANLAPILDAALSEAGVDRGLPPFGEIEGMAADYVTDKFDVVAYGAREADGRTVQRFAIGLPE